jgi:hypothetical protein
MTNLVTYLDITFALVSFQRQADSLYFDHSSALDLVSHHILLYKFCAHVLSDVYVNCVRCYLRLISNQILALMVPIHLHLKTGPLAP